MAKLTLGTIFTLKELFEWFKKENPDSIECTESQWEHYLSLLQPQEKVLRFQGKDVRIHG